MKGRVKGKRTIVLLALFILISSFSGFAIEEGAYIGDRIERVEFGEMKSIFPTEVEKKQNDETKSDSLERIDTNYEVTDRKIYINYYKNEEDAKTRENAVYIDKGFENNGYKIGDDVRILSLEEVNRNSYGEKITNKNPDMMFSGTWNDGKGNKYNIIEYADSDENKFPTFKASEEDLHLYLEWINRDDYEECLQSVCVGADIQYYDRNVGIWNTEKEGIPTIRNLMDYGSGEEEFKVRIEVDWNELIQYFSELNESLDKKIEREQELANKGEGTKFSATLNQTFTVELPEGLDYINGSISFEMGRGSLFKLDDTKGVDYDSDLNTLKIPITLEKEYDDESIAEFLKDLRSSAALNEYGYQLKGFIEIKLMTNDNMSGYSTTFVSSDGEFKTTETRVEEAKQSTLNQIFHLCNLDQLPGGEDYILNNEFLIDVNGTSEEDYNNKLLEIHKKYMYKPTLTVLAPFRINGDLLVNKKGNNQQMSILDDYDTENKKVFKVEKRDVLTILGTLDIYPAMKLFKNIFYHFGGATDSVEVENFTSIFQIKLTIPNGIDLIDRTNAGIKKSLEYKMGNDASFYKIENVKYEDGFKDGSKKIIVDFKEEEDYKSTPLSFLESKINGAITQEIFSSVDNYLYMKDNLVISDKGVDINTIEMQVEGKINFAFPVPPLCEDEKNSMDYSYEYYGIQTPEGRDAHYPSVYEGKKNAMTLTVGIDKLPVGKYKVLYDGNEADAGTVLDIVEYGNKEVVTVKDNEFTKANHIFKSWNTMPNGNGIEYESGDTFIITENVVLFAQWGKDVPSRELIVDESISTGWTWSGGGSTTTTLNKDDHYAYMIGYPNGTVKPEGKITRAEVSTIFFRMMTDSSRNSNWSSVNNYNDVGAETWYNNAISTLSNAKAVTGYPDGSFKPNAKITRGEFATMASRFLSDTSSLTNNKFTDVKGNWAESEINKLASLGLISGYSDGSFKPDQEITRAEAATLMNAVLERTPDKDHLLSNMKTWTDNSNRNAWYYAQIQEATNSHTYTRPSKTSIETWGELLPVRDWAALEKAWSSANSGSGGGSVVK
ncbi:S-layer homology domain-containing protein [Anaerosphaera aminiphila DSM 21120]|uniref:S-layer homology domain-containing protein n=1 Tax=Anaerosphaera aminiphila DSM 21120 TaxID=1120995 RepID=A0A1M5QFL0_9FIRM|nr:S-layer homology domain-containing protein [Anaerosphaera aminiphila]SHH12631.1 S-layer homology domain-containing protein [Anaerosphaera aminiphila DSM 21120]